MNVPNHPDTSLCEDCKVCCLGYFGTYCGCALSALKDECGQARGHGVKVCDQTQARATGAASCACNEGWEDRDGDGNRSLNFIECVWTVW